MFTLKKNNENPLNATTQVKKFNLLSLSLFASLFLATPEVNTILMFVLTILFTFITCVYFEPLCQWDQWNRGIHLILGLAFSNQNGFETHLRWCKQLELLFSSLYSLPLFEHITTQLSQLRKGIWAIPRFYGFVLLE